jgi:RHS repeat-associated protein
MQLHRLILTLVAVSLFVTAVPAATNSVPEPGLPLIASPLNPLQTTQPKLYREHIYAGDQLITSVVYPDLQATNQGWPNLPLPEREPTLIAANTNPTTQRWLLMGHAGTDLLVLLMLAAVLTRFPWRWRCSRRGWRQRFRFAALLLLLSLSLLPLGVAMLANSRMAGMVVDVAPLARGWELPLGMSPRPLVVQSGLPLPVPGDPTWNQYQTQLARPKNDVGVMPNRPQEITNAATTINLASQNFSFTAPILQLTGRGLGVALAAVYNSRVWSETGEYMNWNADDGFPAPGWRLDFGYISPAFVDQATDKTSHLLIQPDGSRRVLRQIPGESGKFQTVDSSFIKFNSSTLVLKTPNGQQIQYQQVTLGSSYRYVPIQITDVNGNYLTIQYVSGTTRLSQITDTLSRVITFEYDPVTARLLRIKAPDFADTTFSSPSVVRTVAEFQYTTLTHTFSFSSSWTVRGASSGSSLTVLSQITYPVTGAAIQFDYEGHGVIKKITRLDPAGGTIGYDQYTLPSSTQTLTEAPRLTARQVWGRNVISTLSFSYASYENLKGPNTLTKAVTDPSGVPRAWTFYASGLDGGQVTHLEVYAQNANVQTATPKAQSLSTWGRDALQENPRITQIQNKEKDTSGGLQLINQQNFYYSDPYGLLTDVIESDGSSPVRRQHRGSFVNYTSSGQYLIGLPQLTEVYDVQGLSLAQALTGGTLAAKTELVYDGYDAGNPLVSYSGVPQYQAPGHTNRGNVTTSRPYYDVQNPTGYSEHITHYDQVGNGVQVEVECCQQRQFVFTATTGFAWPEQIISGPPGLTETTTMSYDYNTGLVISTTDHLNNVTALDYQAGTLRLLETHLPTGLTVTNAYDDVTLSQTTTTPLSLNDPTRFQRTIVWFDGLGRELRKGQWNGSTYQVVSVEYQDGSRLVKQTNPFDGGASGTAPPPPGTGITQKNFDELGQVTQVTLPDQNTVLNSYEPKVVTSTDPVGRQKRGVRDGLGRLIRADEPDTWNNLGSVSAPIQPTSYTYNVLDKMTQSNQGGQLRTFQYDALARLTSETTPEAGTVIYQYNDFHQMTLKRDARGVETHLEYNARNQLTRVLYTGTNGGALPSGVIATPDVLYTYNPTIPSRLTQASDELGTESYSYDTLGRMTAVTRVLDNVSYMTQYVWDEANQVVETISPSGRRVKAFRDSVGRLTGLKRTNVSGGVINTYVANVVYQVGTGLLTQVTLGNNLREDYTYDSLRFQLTQKQVVRTSPNTTLFSVSYSYQALAGQAGPQAGNAGAVAFADDSQQGDIRYEYDAVGRLTSEQFIDPWIRSYFTYDRWGNLTQVRTDVGWENFTETAIVATDSQGIPTNRYATVDFKPQGYDAAGQLTDDYTYLYKYDAAGRLREVSLKAGNVLQQKFWYDHRGRRVKKEDHPQTGPAHWYYCLWSGEQVMVEYQTLVGTTFPPGTQPEQAAATDTLVDLRYVHWDVRSVRLVTDGNGNQVDTQSHDAFGGEMDDGGEVPPFFTTYDREMTELDYARARYYRSNHRRFTSPDSYRGSYRRGDPQSLNRYAYVANDPVNRIDPTGQEFCVRVCDYDEYCWVECSFEDPIGSGGVGEISLECRLPAYGQLDPELKRVLGERGEQMWKNMGVDDQLTLLATLAKMKWTGLTPFFDELRVRWCASGSVGNNDQKCGVAYGHVYFTNAGRMAVTFMNAFSGNDPRYSYLRRFFETSGLIKNALHDEPFGFREYGSDLSLHLSFSNAMNYLEVHIDRTGFEHLEDIRNGLLDPKVLIGRLLLDPNVGPTLQRWLGCTGSSGGIPKTGSGNGKSSRLSID